MNVTNSSTRLDVADTARAFIRWALYPLIWAWVIANRHEAKNFGATLSVFDICFGTFHYRPGVAPAELGLSVDDGYPGQHDPLRAVLFPFSLKPVTSLGET